MVDRYVAAMTANDPAAAAALLADDFVEEYPQSGEIIRGRDNWRAVLEHLPNREEAASPVAPGSVRVIGGEDRWVLTPTFTTLKVEGTGDRYTVVFRVTYPNDGDWYVVSLLEVADDAISRATTFFGPMFPPAEWRAQFVEVRPDH